MVSERPLFVDGVLQSFTGFEFRLFGSRDLNCFAGARIATGRRATLRDAEGSKPDQANFATAGKSRSDSVESCFDGLGGIGFGLSRRFGDICHEIVFVHDWAPSWLAIKMKLLSGSLFVIKGAKSVRAVSLFVKGKKRVIPRFPLFFRESAGLKYCCEFAEERSGGDKKRGARRRPFNHSKMIFLSELRRHRDPRSHPFWRPFRSRLPHSIRSAPGDLSGRDPKLRRPSRLE